MRKLLLTAGVAMLALAGTANAATKPAHHPGLDCKNVETMTTQWLCDARAATKKPVVKCKAGYVKKTVRVRKRVHGKMERVKTVKCVRKPLATIAPPTIPAPAATVPVVRAGIDPSYTQDPNDGRHVTWTYSASSAGTIPTGVLSLQVQTASNGTVVGGCTMNVGGTTLGGTCTVELPAYGTYQVTVTYTGNDPTVAPSTETDTEDIEPLPVPPVPPPAPITVAKAWGTDAPSSIPTISANVIGQTATLVITDANFEGATSLTLTDDLGDGCTANVTGTQATCAMSVTGTPSSFTVGYPGGTTTTNTVGQQETITTWPPDNVQVSNPNVTVQQATVLECGGFQQGGPLWYPSTANVGCGPNPGNDMTSGQWPNPVEIGTGVRVEFSAEALGSLASDQAPAGYLTYTLTGPAAPSFEYDEDYGLNPNASQDCSQVTNDPGQAVGGCMYTFSTPGDYTLTVSFTSSDPNYAGASLGYTETISVT